MNDELWTLLTQDDAAVAAQKSLEEEKKQTALLEDMRNVLLAPGMPNANIIAKLDLSEAHTEEEVFVESPDFSATGFTILAQEVDYWYGFDYGDRIHVPAGYVGGVMSHKFKRLLITHADTSSTTMEIVIGGVKSV